MSLRIKFWLGLGFLVLIMAAVVVLSLLSVRRLTESGTKVIRDNYRSLEYMQALDSLVDAHRSRIEYAHDPCAGYLRWLQRVDSLVLLQQQNITEPGEREATQHLSAATRDLPDCGEVSTKMLPRLEAIHNRIDIVAALNLKAIRTKSEAAEVRGSKAMQEAVMVATVVFLIVLMFAASFPRTFILPLSELTRMAQRLAGGAYGEQVPIDNDNDEIGQLALAFNEMSTELAHYKRSSLAQLMEAQQRTEQIINRLHSPLIVTDAGWRILFFNDLARQVLGTLNAPLVGSNLLELAVRNDLLRTWLVPVTEGKPTSSDPTAVTVGKRQRYFLTEAFPIAGSNHGETILGYVLSMTDVTRFRELDQAKTDFLATVAHELKTPLSTLNISLSILKGGKAGLVSEDQKGLMSTMSAELARLMTLINGLLDLSRIESGTEQGEGEPHQINVASLLEKVVARYQIQAEEKRIRFHLDSPPKAYWLSIEMDSLALAFGNLISNAVRFSPQGGTISVTAKEENGKLEIAVEDQGPGIPEDDQDRVFEKYFHGSSDGTGLGLFIARGVLEKARAGLRVHSREKGSQFIISLPLVPVQSITGD